MPAYEPGLRRVTVHADSTSVDLTLPANIAVGELIPSIVGIVGGAAPGARYHLARLGASALPNSTTLGHNGVRDGAELVLSRQSPAPATVRYDDEADAVSAALGRPARSWQPKTAVLGAVCFTIAAALALIRYAAGAVPHADVAVATAGTATVIAVTTMVAILPIRRDPMACLTVSLVATMSAAVAGLLAVPGPPGAVNVLLAAMAAGVTAVLAIRISHCNIVILAATAVGSTIAAVAALAGVITGAPTQAVASVTAFVCLGLIEVAPRWSIRLTGLMPDIDRDHPRPESQLNAKARHAHTVLTSLRGGSAAAATIAAGIAALATHRAIASAAVTAAVLIVHARTDSARAPLFASAGIATLTTTLVILAIDLPRQAAWVAVLASAAAATAIYLGFVAPAVAPVGRRGVRALGCVALTLAAPVTCWTCGAFGAVRGLNLLRT
ncbi:type VII secretion integral membrane protein EccD [Mycobacterium camsae]|uniref:type VII secretion integral membrane protein EccD n=1 Tax=Mycobacterium gordonae TaxID=1778 RepID=UPI00197E68E5|nr:type VII secretion integral membrane protein EccD [Mycobacterium gordonae]